MLQTYVLQFQYQLQVSKKERNFKQLPNSSILILLIALPTITPKNITTTKLNAREN